MQVIAKQLNRVGLTKYDMASLAGDVGGENEGVFQKNSTLNSIALKTLRQFFYDCIKL